MHRKYIIVLGVALKHTSNLWLGFRVFLKQTVLRSFVFILS